VTTRVQDAREPERVLRSWLLTPPRPHVVRVTTTDGETRNVTVGSSKFLDLAKTILTLGPELLEALDSKENLLRAVHAEELLSEAEELPAHTTTPAPPPALSGVPSIGELVGEDAETRRFALIAHLLADAYRHSNDVAFAKLAEFTAQQSERATSAERALDQFIRAEQLRLEVARAELDARIAAQREADEEEDEEDASPIKEAFDKIAKHVADSVGGDDDEDDEEPTNHAAPNGVGGH
jgi:predicted Zn-dependent protease